MNINWKAFVVAFTVAYLVSLAVFLSLKTCTASAHTVTAPDCARTASLWPTPESRQLQLRNCNKLRIRHANAHWCQRLDLTPFAAIDCWWPAGSREKAKDVAECESTASVSNEYARAHGLGRWSSNSSGHVGIMQLGAPERRANGWYVVGDPAIVQIKSALNLFNARGWQPWVCG